MITVRYFYSACVGIETPDVSILCDPWFTEGAYDGAWYQFPRLNEPITTLGRYDAIYISHIHPDHYDPTFLKQYLARYPETRVLISSDERTHLSRKMKIDGIPHEPIQRLQIGKTSLGIFPNLSHPADVDTALAVRCEDDTVVNMNDNSFNEAQLSAIKDFCGNKIDIALLPYTGAGPYPQTYVSDGAKLEELARAKKLDFFERYRRLREALNSKVSIPFAGKYLLGGKLSKLNPYRGVADAVEILALDSRAIVLADGGKATINTKHLLPSAIRTAPYSMDEIDRRLKEIDSQPMDYEITFAGLNPERIPFLRLLPKAYESAVKRSHCNEDYFIAIRLPQGWFIGNANRHNPMAKSQSEPPEAHSPRSEVFIDPRYLYGILTCVYHWNNAQIGSQFNVRRYPDRFVREAEDFLNFFHV